MTTQDANDLALCLQKTENAPDRAAEDAVLETITEHIFYRAALYAMKVLPTFLYRMKGSCIKLSDTKNGWWKRSLST